MTQPPHDAGITVSGGQFSGPVAFGHQAQATQHIAGNLNINPEVRAEFDRLRELLNEHREELADADVLEGECNIIDEEFRLPPARRSRDRLLGALQNIGLHAAEVAAIVASIDKIRQLVL